MGTFAFCAEEWDQVTSSHVLVRGIEVAWLKPWKRTFFDRGNNTRRAKKAAAKGRERRSNLRQSNWHVKCWPYMQQRRATTCRRRQWRSWWANDWMSSLWFLCWVAPYCLCRAFQSGFVPPANNLYPIDGHWAFSCIAQHVTHFSFLLDWDNDVWLNCLIC